MAYSICTFDHFNTTIKLAVLMLPKNALDLNQNIGTLSHSYPDNPVLLLGWLYLDS